MILREDINFDLILRMLLSDMADAVDGWSNGEPRDETALMNRITERLRRNRRKCDVGTNSQVEVFAEFSSLHRRGTRQTDQFGADLAVTVEVPSHDFIKTAFFQLKVSHHYRVSIERRQLTQGREFPGVQERSFVLAVDDPGHGFRIWPSPDCVRDMAAETREFDTSQWEFLAEWVVAWFGCQRGLPSKADDPQAVEKLLEVYRLAAARDVFDQVVQANLPPRSPAKSWLNYTLRRRPRH